MAPLRATVTTSRWVEIQQPDRNNPVSRIAWGDIDLPESLQHSLTLPAESHLTENSLTVTGSAINGSARRITFKFESASEAAEFHEQCTVAFPVRVTKYVNWLSGNQVRFLTVVPYEKKILWAVSSQVFTIFPIADILLQP